MLKGTLRAALRSPHALTSTAPHPPHATLGGAPAQRGPVVVTKSGFFMQNPPPPPAQTMSPLWQAQRRGRVEGLAGQDRTLTAGQEVTGLSPNAPLWLPGSQRSARNGTIRCPLRAAHGMSWRQPGASGSLCALPHGCHQPRRCHQTVTDHPKHIHGCKTTRTGCVHHRESCCPSRWAPRHHSDGKEMWDVLNPSGTSLVVALASEWEPGHHAYLGCGSAAVRPLLLRMSALLSLPHNAQEAPRGRGERQGGVSPSVTAEGLFQGPRVPPKQSRGTL